MYSSSFQGNDKVYSIDDRYIEIYGRFIFKKMRQLGWEVCTYSYNGNYIDLYGGYPKNKFIQMKKFFYDEYPFVIEVQPRVYGIRIYFSDKVVVIYSSLNTAEN